MTSRRPAARARNTGRPTWRNRRPDQSINRGYYYLGRVLNIAVDHQLLDDHTFGLLLHYMAKPGAVASALIDKQWGTSRIDWAPLRPDIDVEALARILKDLTA